MAKHTKRQPRQQRRADDEAPARPALGEGNEGRTPEEARSYHRLIAEAAYSFLRDRAVRARDDGLARRPLRRRRSRSQIDGAPTQ